MISETAGGAVGASGAVQTFGPGRCVLGWGVDLGDWWIRPLRRSATELVIQHLIPFDHLLSGPHIGEGAVHQRGGKPGPVLVVVVVGAAPVGALVVAPVGAEQLLGKNLVRQVAVAAKEQARDHA